MIVQFFSRRMRRDIAAIFPRNAVDHFRMTLAEAGTSPNVFNLQNRDKITNPVSFTRFFNVRLIPNIMHHASILLIHPRCPCVDWVRTLFCFRLSIELLFHGIVDIPLILVVAHETGPK